MTLLLPEVWDVDEGGFANQGELSINESFTDTLKCLVHGQITPDDAVLRWGDSCAAFARDASAMAQGQDYSTQAELQEEFRELCDEANTWSLLKHTFCSSDARIGPCPVASATSPSAGNGLMNGLLEHFLYLVDQDVGLRRVAQLTAWLEELARDELQEIHGRNVSIWDTLNTHFGGTGYTRGEAIERLRTSLSSSDIVYQDPDASTWQSSTFRADPATAVEDERLLTAVYALMRAGCEDDALELCSKSACAWRSAAMSACGWGLLPVGQEAPAAQKLLTEKARRAAIAADVLSLRQDGAAMAPSCAAAACSHRQTWRSACSAVAGAAAQRAAAGTAECMAAGWEAAVFGILAGNCEHCEGPCKTWRDRLWVQVRALLQIEPERLLLSGAVSGLGVGPSSRRAHAWDASLSRALDAPLELPSVPEARSGSSVSEHVQDFVKMLGRESAADVRVHDQIQRHLIAAALQPLCTVEETATHHPLQALLELLLSFATMPAPSAAVRDHRIRFAAHFGLAMVSLNAIPGDPEMKTQLWHEFSDSLSGRLLQMVNSAVYSHLDNLAALEDSSSSFLIPQYACLLRATFAQATLRRCFQSFLPAVPAAAFEAADAATVMLTGSDVLVGANLTAQPPAAECFEAALNADAWLNCKLILDKLIHNFVLQRARGPASMPPCLPATPVRFDDVLCSTVRDSVESASAVLLDSVAMVKWLLLPYLNRKDFRQPFLGDGESSEGHICWVCTVQAVFLAVGLCRRTALAGAAQQYAAYALLQDLDSSAYSCHLPSAVGMSSAMEGDDEGAEDCTRSLFDVVGARCRIPQHDQEEELLVAVQRAMTELTEWHDALSLKDMMATCGRAVTTNAVSYLQPALLSEALVSAAAVPHGSVTGGSCRLSAEGVTGEHLRNIGVQLVLCKRPAEVTRSHIEASDADGGGRGGCQGWDLWGGSSCLSGDHRTGWQQAATLAKRVEQALVRRLGGGAAWEAAGLPHDTKKTVSVHAEAVGLEASEPDSSDAAGAAAVHLQVNVDAQAVAGEQPQHWQESLHACLDVVVTACMDLIRGDLLHGEDGKSTLMHVLKLTASPSDDVASEQWQLSSLAAPGSALGGIHHSHVLGDSMGRFELLRMLSGRTIRAEIAVWASRLQLWAAQAGSSEELHPSSLDLEEMCMCGMWVDEKALEMMSACQLQEVLMNAELAALHDSSRRA